MPLRPVLEYPDPRLREPAVPVRAFDAGLAALTDDLRDTLADAGGLGLSAPQIGDDRAVLVVDLSDDGTGAEVYVNPVLLGRAAPGLVEESCLSIPGVVGNVIRHTEVRVRAVDVAGDPFERELSGMAAVCLQHEMDHLNGTLFIDRLSLLRRLRLRFAGVRTRRPTRLRTSSP